MTKRYTLGSSSISDLEKKYVQQVLDNNFISPGPVVAEVEKRCAEMHNMRYCVTLNSGQSALQVALQALVIKHPRLTQHNKRPLVAVPTCTYISSLAAAIYAGCDICLVDVELTTGNMAPEALKDVISYQTRIDKPVDIVMPVHLYGKACDSKIRDICWENKLLVVEDACEATFVPYIGWGDILTTSFFSNHLISGGSGGAIMTNDLELELISWKIINHGRNARFNNDNIHQIADKFRFDSWGHSYKWSDVNAAIVKAQIERKDELFGARRRNADVLRKMLNVDAVDGKLILPNPEGHCFMMYPIIVSADANCSKVITYLNDMGIEVRRMMPITNQPVVEKYFSGRDLKKQFPNANIINEYGFYVGCHPELSVDDMEFIGASIRNGLGA